MKPTKLFSANSDILAVVEFVLDRSKINYAFEVSVALDVAAL